MADFKHVLEKQKKIDTLSQIGQLKRFSLFFSTDDRHSAVYRE